MAATTASAYAPSQGTPMPHTYASYTSRGSYPTYPTTAASYHYGGSSEVPFTAAGYNAAVLQQQRQRTMTAAAYDPYHQLASPARTAALYDSYRQVAARTASPYDPYSAARTASAYRPEDLSHLRSVGSSGPATSRGAALSRTASSLYASSAARGRAPMTAGAFPKPVYM